MENKNNLNEESWLERKAKNAALDVGSSLTSNATVQGRYKRKEQAEKFIQHYKEYLARSNQVGNYASLKDWASGIKEPVELTADHLNRALAEIGMPAIKGSTPVSSEQEEVTTDADTTEVDSMPANSEDEMDASDLEDDMNSDADSAHEPEDMSQQFDLTPTAGPGHSGEQSGDIQPGFEHQDDEGNTYKWLGQLWQRIDTNGKKGIASKEEQKALNDKYLTVTESATTASRNIGFSGEQIRSIMYSLASVVALNSPVKDDQEEAQTEFDSNEALAEIEKQIKQLKNETQLRLLIKQLKGEL